MPTDLDNPSLDADLVAVDSPDAGLISGSLFLALVRRLKTLWDARDNLVAHLTTIDGRLDALEGQPPIALLPSVPANYPRGFPFMVQGDPNLYIGTGPTTPLRKLPTQAV